MEFIEYTNVTLKMLIDAGVIKADTEIYSSSQPEIIGKIKSNGSISILLGSQYKTFHSPSGAAKAILKVSVNGWIFWKILFENEYKELSFLRELYLNKQKKN